MEVLDHLNAKDGRGTLYFAGQGVQQQWQMKREMLSPRYTTRYSDLLQVRWKMGANLMPLFPSFTPTYEVGIKTSRNGLVLKSFCRHERI